jgi:hypothetical protein
MNDPNSVFQHVKTLVQQRQRDWNYGVDNKKDRSVVQSSLWILIFIKEQLAAAVPLIDITRCREVGPDGTLP